MKKLKKTKRLGGKKKEVGKIAFFGNNNLTFWHFSSRLCDIWKSTRLALFQGQKNDHLSNVKQVSTFNSKIKSLVSIRYEVRYESLSYYVFSYSLSYTYNVCAYIPLFVVKKATKNNFYLTYQF